MALVFVREYCVLTMTSFGSKITAASTMRRIQGVNGDISSLLCRSWTRRWSVRSGAHVVGTAFWTRNESAGDGEAWVHKCQFPRRDDRLSRLMMRMIPSEEPTKDKCQQKPRHDKHVNYGRHHRSPLGMPERHRGWMMPLLVQGILVEGQ